MAEFASPFSGVVPGRAIAPRELTRGLRMMLAAEQEAVHLYEALADATDHALAKAVLQDIADEERVHAGEFQRLLSILLPDEDARLREGADEVDAEAKSLAGQPAAAEGPAVETPAVKTIGDLRGAKA